MKDEKILQDELMSDEELENILAAQTVMFIMLA